MISISDDAVSHLTDLQQAHPGHALRVAVVGGPQGPGLGIIPDKKTTEDLVFTSKNIELVIEKNLLHYCRQITIGFQAGEKGACGGSSGSGFLLVAEVPIG